MAVFLTLSQNEYDAYFLHAAELGFDFDLWARRALRETLEAEQTLRATAAEIEAQPDGPHSREARMLARWVAHAKQMGKPVAEWLAETLDTVMEREAAALHDRHDA